MKANEANLLRFLDSTKQFILPIFQRRYSWEKRQCKQLWDDILRVGKNEDIPSHFLGSIVYIGGGSPTLPKFRVIDGQQRLATLSLLISVLGRAIEVQNVDIRIDGSRIDRSRLEDYLFNHREDGELRHKQLLTQHDRETLIQLLEEGEASDDTSLLVKNYRFFEAQLKRADLETVYKGIQKLIIVDIALDLRSDNPQLIFESLNSTGLDLSQADRIRNYVLMGQESDIQNTLYKIWYSMEQSFGVEYTERFGDFIRGYLTLKMRQIPNQKRVYESFKRYVAGKEQPEALEAIIREIVDYSEHYVRIALLEEEDRELRACLEDIHALGVEVSFPFLLGVYEDYTQRLIEKAEVIEIFRLIESYVFRRAICDVPTNTLNQNFATLMEQIDRDDYLQSLKVAFSQMSRRKHFPSDYDFQQAFPTKNVYNPNNPRIGNYLLRKLENHGRKEPIRVEDYTIEHVMPQTLPEEWKEELGANWSETHEKYLHTIGNLTLTGYNSELSNHSFKEKQDFPGGFRDSPLYLNKSLREPKQWDETAIIDRAEILSEKALEIWPNHGVLEKVRFLRKTDWTLYDHRYLTGDMMRLFEKLRWYILNLDASVSEQINKRDIAYKYNHRKILVKIVPQANRLRLSLKLPFFDINGLQTWSRDLTNLGELAEGNVEVRISSSGDVEVRISSAEQLDYIMFLIRQAFRHMVDRS